MVPYSTTKTERSLKSTARSEIVFARFCISLEDYTFDSSSSKVSSTNYSSDWCVLLEPWSSYTLEKCSFSVLRSSKVICLSFSASVNCMFLRTKSQNRENLLCSSAFSWIWQLTSCLSFYSEDLIRLVISLVLAEMFSVSLSSSSKKLSLILFCCIFLSSLTTEALVN